MVSRFEQFCASISSIYHDIQRIERVEMAKYGLKGPHVQCLAVMSRYPAGITASQLCSACDKDKAAISRTVAELEQAGLVERLENNGSRYRAPLFLTEQGRETAQRVNDRVCFAVERAGAGLSDAQREVLYTVLDRIAGNLQAISAEGLEE